MMDAEHQCRFTNTDELGVLEENDAFAVLIRRCRECGLHWKVTVQVVDLGPTPAPE